MFYLLSFLSNLHVSQKCHHKTDSFIIVITHIVVYTDGFMNAGNCSQSFQKLDSTWYHYWRNEFSTSVISSCCFSALSSKTKVLLLAVLVAKEVWKSDYLAFIVLRQKIEWIFLLVRYNEWQFIKSRDLWSGQKLLKRQS